MDALTAAHSLAHNGLCRLHAVNPAHHSTHRARMHGITVAATRLHARPGWPDDESTCHRERPCCCSPLEPPLWLAE